jgi:hypothetical protein
MTRPPSKVLRSCASLTSVTSKLHSHKSTSQVLQVHLFGWFVQLCSMSSKFWHDFFAHWCIFLIPRLSVHCLFFYDETIKRELNKRFTNKSLSKANKKILEPEPELVLSLSIWYKIKSNLAILIFSLALTLSLHNKQHPPRDPGNIDENERPYTAEIGLRSGVRVSQQIRQLSFRVAVKLTYLRVYDTRTNSAK